MMPGARSRPVAALAAAVLLSCGGGRDDRGASDPAGYWEGEGEAREVLLDDAYRHLERSAEFDFWFTVGPDGEAGGEIELVYDAVLTVENLPQLSVPAPAGTSVSFAPEVGGKLVDLQPRRSFPLVGVLDRESGELRLALATPEEDREPLEFVIRADPGVSAGIAGAGVPLPEAGEATYEIPMTPFSPFAGPAAVEQRPGGPFAARFEASGEEAAVSWTATQEREEPAEVELTEEMREALERLRAGR